MSVSPHIKAVAELVRDIDPGLADAFISQPFNRHALVTAFHGTLCSSQYAHLADHIAVTLRSAIDRDSRELAVAIETQA